MVDAALRAAGRRSGALHLAAPGRSIGAVRHRRPSGRRGRPGGGGRRRARRRRAASRRRRASTCSRRSSKSTTAIAFELFRRAEVEVAVLEVGLGGRLDATNIVSPPALIATAITSIAFDHQLYLGSTLREIAVEKAGIIKPGVPVVVGPVDGEAFAAIEQVAAARRAPLIRASVIDCDGMTIGLAGEHQRSNAAVARPSSAAAGRCGRRRAAIGDRSWPGSSAMARTSRPAPSGRRPRAAARRRAQPGRRRGAGVLSGGARRSRRRSSSRR